MAFQQQPEQQKPAAAPAPQDEAARIERFRATVERVFGMRRQELLDEQRQGHEPLRSALAEHVHTASQPDLHRLEQEHPGSLAFFFGKKIAGGKEQILHLQESYGVGDRITIDFQGNHDAEWNIGAGDLLPPHVRKIRVIDDQGRERVSERRLSDHGGFFDRNGYIPVFTGYTVVIEEVIDDVAVTELQQELKQDGSAALRADHDFLRSIYNLPDDTPITYDFLTRVSKKGPGGTDIMHGEVRGLDLARERYGHLFSRASQQFNIAEYVLYAICQKESNFNPNNYTLANAREQIYAVGLFQAKPEVWEDFQKANPDYRGRHRTDPEASIMMGAWYLDLIVRVGKQKGVPIDRTDVNALYLSFHDGPSAYRSQVRTGERSQAQWYADKVVATASRYQNLLQS